MDTAGVVVQIERGLDAELHLVPELLGRAGERCRDSKLNLIIGHPADSRSALTCIANRRGACCILADGSRVRRRTRGANGGIAAPIDAAMTRPARTASRPRARGAGGGSVSLREAVSSGRCARA